MGSQFRTQPMDGAHPVSQPDAQPRPNDDVYVSHRAYPIGRPIPGWVLGTARNGAPQRVQWVQRTPSRAKEIKNELKAK